jgi:hypothetical protein
LDALAHPSPTSPPHTLHLRYEEWKGYFLLAYDEDTWMKMLTATRGGEDLTCEQIVNGELDGVADGHAGSG